jgi:hypothetical protein
MASGFDARVSENSWKLKSLDHIGSPTTKAVPPKIHKTNLRVTGLSVPAGGMLIGNPLSFQPNRQQF